MAQGLRWIVTGTLSAVDGTRSITLAEPGHAAAVLPLAPKVAVRVAGRASSLASLATGQRVAAAINHRAEVTAIQAAGAPAAGPGSGSAVPALRIAPNPVAAAGSLAAGQSVFLAVYAVEPDGGPAAGATVFLTFTAAAGGGSASVGSTTLGPDAVAFTAGRDGTLTVTYAAPAVLPSGGTDILTATSRWASGAAVATDAYSFAPPPAGGAAVAPRTISGRLVAVDATDLALTIGATTSVYPLGPAVTVIAGQRRASLGALTVGQTVTLTINGQGQVAAVEVTAPAPPGGAGQPGQTS